MKKLILVTICLTFLVAWSSGPPQLDEDNWNAANPISPPFGKSQELVDRFPDWPNYEGVYDTMNGVKSALAWCKNEASVNYEYRKGTYKPDDKRNYGFVNRPTAKGAPRRRPSDPEWMKDCTECMEALGFEYTGPKE